jgi:hypothetical protein
MTNNATKKRFRFGKTEHRDGNSATPCLTPRDARRGSLDPYKENHCLLEKQNRKDYIQKNSFRFQKQNRILFFRQTILLLLLTFDGTSATPG